MNDQVRAKKHLGQHFLNDQNIAEKIAMALKPEGKYKKCLEVGPGMGVLTKFLLQRNDLETWVCEIDRESVAYLSEHYPELRPRIIADDFLRKDFREFFNEPAAVIGNFPYNISTQILFRVLDFKDAVPEVVGMFQKEVALRIAEKPGTKTYGITSVLLQAWYDIEYLFTVPPNVFTPPPNVNSAVIRLRRNNTTDLGCDEHLFKQVVKAAFNQRRKQLRNSLHAFDIIPGEEKNPIFTERPERLSVQQFVDLTRILRREPG
jgi:16S rRNA (adenine1518-N6/adenine1519-N6)-dimethyltransferase